MLLWTSNRIVIYLLLFLAQSRRLLAMDLQWQITFILVEQHSFDILDFLILILFNFFDFLLQFEVKGKEKTFVVFGLLLDGALQVVGNLF